MNELLSGSQKTNELDIQYSPYAKLYIQTDPPDTAIRILNIAPKFYQGIKLEPGKYHIEVSAEGYTTHKQWITLDSGETLSIRDICLSPSESISGVNTDHSDNLFERFERLKALSKPLYFVK